MLGAERYCRDQQAAVSRQQRQQHQLKAGSGVKQRHQLGSRCETELGLAGQQLGPASMANWLVPHRGYAPG